jgi:hypothetical protein
MGKKKKAVETKTEVLGQDVNTVHSTIVSNGRKKYYFDVRKAKTGNLYLCIKEVTIGDTMDRSESRRILVFDNCIKDFAESIQQCAKHFPVKNEKKEIF